MRRFLLMSALLGVLLLLPLAHGEAKSVPKPDEVRAVYLSIDSIRREAKIQELEQILVHTHANGIVIDYKDSAELPIAYMQKLVARFKQHGAYTIARIVVFQDSQFAKRNPQIAIKKRSGEFWYSGRAVWKRYWLDPASQLAQDYNIEVAMRAIDAGFDEIQFDYIRFPTDGDMKDIQFPIFKENLQTKGEVMDAFFKKIRSRLNAYAPQVLLSIDVFGEVFVYGGEKGIGQHIEHIAKYFDVLAPMAYPSHYKCRAFGVQDPTAEPYRVYYETIRKGMVHLGGMKPIIRPWIQDFTIGSIYGCGSRVFYTPEKVRAQIQAGRDLGVKGFMLWNVRSNFTREAFR